MTIGKSVANMAENKKAEDKLQQLQHEEVVLKSDFSLLRHWYIFDANSYQQDYKLRKIRYAGFAICLLNLAAYLNTLKPKGMGALVDAPQNAFCQGNIGKSVVCYFQIRLTADCAIRIFLL